MEELKDINVTERLAELLKRRNIDLSNIKFRGRLRTIKWNVFEASQKQHLMKGLDKSLSEI
jgi:hypothetical protein